MTILRFLMAGVAMVIAAELVAATPVVSNVVAKQRYPWNGLVDITCNMSGFDEATKVQEFFVEAVIPGSKEVRIMSHFWVVRDGARSTNCEVSTNGNYRLLWDAKADLGEVAYSNMVVRVTTKNVKVQLWENGPYWATTNIGAEAPEDYGYYFWWGDTVGYKRENDKWVASDGSSSNFSFSSGNTPTYGNSDSNLRSKGWITADGVLAPEHDAAHIHWGGDWRMLTKDEFDALNSNCDWIWTTQNGVNGYVVRGRGDYADNSIFLPCAGFGYGTSLLDAGSGGIFWSSVPFWGTYNAWNLDFASGHHYTFYHTRYHGHPVRPVQGFTK